MIAYIKGHVAATGEEKLVLEAGNMGYNILMPVSSLESLHKGQEVKIYTHLNVRLNDIFAYCTLY